MVNIPAEYKEIINGLSELYIGNDVTAVIPSGTAAGWVEANNISIYITPPTKSGMTCVGWILSYDGGTYRIQSPHVKRPLANGNWVVSAYVVTTLIYDVSLSFKPLYIKS